MGVTWETSLKKPIFKIQKRTRQAYARDGAVPKTEHARNNYRTKRSPAHKRLILTHRRDLNKRDFLIDDRTANGAGEFEGELLHFGTERFPDWDAVVKYLMRDELLRQHSHSHLLASLDQRVRLSRTQYEKNALQPNREMLRTPRA